MDTARTDQSLGALIRELDGILANEHHYILTWEEPFSRMAFWNKFGHPDSYLTRIGDYRDMTTLWWLDPQKDQRLAQAMRENSQLAVGSTDVPFWREFAQRQGQRPAAAPAAE